MVVSLGGFVFFFVAALPADAKASRVAKASAIVLMAIPLVGNAPTLAFQNKTTSGIAMTVR